MDKTVILNKATLLSEDEGSVSQSNPREKVNKSSFMKSDTEKDKLKRLKKEHKHHLNNK